MTTADRLVGRNVVARKTDRNNNIFGRKMLKTGKTDGGGED
jgi:hypothetical protein